MEMRMKIHLD